MLGKIPLSVPMLKLHRFGKYVRRINKGEDSRKFSPNIIQVSKSLDEKWMQLINDQKQEQPTTSTRSECEKEENPSLSYCTVIPEPTGTVYAPQIQHDPEIEHASANPPEIKHDVSVSVSHLSTQESRKRQEHPSLDPNEAKKRKTQTTAQRTGPDSFGKPEEIKSPKFTPLKTTNNNPVRTEPVAITPCVDSFAQAMDLLKSNTNNNHYLNDITANSNVNRNGKPCKHVRFKSDNDLCQVKIVERVVYEGEEYQTMQPIAAKAARELDLREGRYLQPLTRVSAKMNWETPAEVMLTHETINNLETIPLVSRAAMIQDDREKTHEEIKYDDWDEIPDTPNEPMTEDIMINESSFGPPRSIKLSQKLRSDSEVSQCITQVHQDGNLEDGTNTMEDLLDRLDQDSNAILGLSAHNKLSSRDIFKRVDLNSPANLSLPNPKT